MSLFPFSTLRTIIGGTSAIDLDGLQLEDRAEAERFLESYGFDWSRRSERAEGERIRRRAVAFIEECLLEPGEAMDPGVRDVLEVPDLLVLVSGEGRTHQKLWACALLRVMHTVAHAASDMSSRFGDEIRDQVLERFRAHVRERDGAVHLGDVPIVRYEERPQKSESSLVMKLLQKPRNVAHDVFDRIGIRFVAHDRLGALLVIRYLRINHLINFANVKPSRSHNTLVDLDRLERALTVEDVTIDELAQRIESWPYPDETHANPHSHDDYRAIHFTGRNRVRIGDGAGGELRFFFPFEVQVLDQASYQASRAGWASHEAYKARQRQASRGRVLRGLV